MNTTLGRRFNPISTSIAAMLAVTLAQVGHGATITSVAPGGNWADLTTWNGGLGPVPGPGDNVNFFNAPSVTVDVTTPQSVGGIYLSTTAGATTNTYTLNISADLAVGTVTPFNYFNNTSFFVSTGANKATVEQTGGAVTIGSKLSLGPDVNGIGTWNLTAGSIRLTSATAGNHEIAIGNNTASSNGGVGTLSISGSSQVLDAGTLRMGYLGNSTATGNLSLNGTATLTMGELIGYRGSVTVAGGTLTGTTGAARMILGWATGAGGAANMTYTQSGGNVTFTSTSAFNAANYIGVDGGTAVANVSGGTMTLSNGVSGHLHIGANAGVSNGTLNISGGTVNVGTRVVMGAGYPGEVFNGIGSATGNGNATLTLSGTGVLNIGVGSGGDTDRGYLYLKGAAGAGVGQVSLNGGTLSLVKFQIGAGGVSRTIAFNGGTVQARANRTDFLDAGAVLNVQDGGAKFDTNSFNITVAGNLLNAGTGVGGVTKSGAGVLTLTGANTYGGPTIVNGGGIGLSGVSTSPLTFGANTKLIPAPNAVGSLTVPSLTMGAGMTFDFEFSGGLTDLVTVSTAGGLTLSNAAVNLFDVGTTSAFTTNGTYTLFDYNSSFAGSLGGLSVANPAPGKSYAFVNDAGGTTIQLTIADTVVPTWNVAGGGSWANAGNWAPASVPNGVGVVAKFGTSITAPSTVDVGGAKTLGALVLEGANSYTLSGAASDVITMNNGAAPAGISVNSGNHTISAPVVLQSDAAVSLGGGAVLTIGGDISGTRGVSVTGSGSLILAGTNTYGNGTIIGGGAIVQLGNGGNAGSITGDVTNNGTLAFNRSDAVTFGGIISGTGSVLKSGGNQLTLASANTYSGGTTIAGGRLSVAADANLGASSAPVNFDGGTLEYSASATTSRPMTVAAGGGTLEIGAGVTVGSSGGISGPGNVFAKTGTGTWNINGATAFTGTLNINGGVVNVPLGAGSFGANPTINVSNATFNVAKTDLFGNAAGSTQSITINAGGLVTNGTATNNGFNAFVDVNLNGGELRVTGTSRAVGAPAPDNSIFQAYEIKGSVTVGGTQASSITNPTNVVDAGINIGPLVEGGQTTFNVADVTGDSNADLTVSATLKNTALPSFAIINTGLIKSGAGTMVLAATNRYSGATTVAEGTFIVDGSIANSSTTVLAGTLGGTGTTGAVGVSSGGTLAPGPAGAGTGTLRTGNLDLQIGSTLAIELNGAVAGSGYDQVSATGFVGVAGNLNLSLGYDPVDGVDTFYIVLNDGSDGVAGTFLGLAQGGNFNVGGQGFVISYTADSALGGLAGFGSTTGNDIALLAVPEPGSWLMLLGGLGGLVAMQRRRR